MPLAKAPYNFTSARFSGILQQNQPISDDSGGTVDNWVNLLTTRVSLEKRSGRLSNGEGKMEYQRDYLLICRFQLAITVNADTRWLISGIPYKIEDYELVNMKPDYYNFYVTKNG